MATTNFLGRQSLHSFAALPAIPFAILTIAFCTRSVPQNTGGGEGGEAMQTACFTCVGRASLRAWVPRHTAEPVSLFGHGTGRNLCLHGDHL